MYYKLTGCLKKVPSICPAGCLEKQIIKCTKLIYSLNGTPCHRLCTAYLISRSGVCDDGVAVAAHEPRDPLPAALGVVGNVVGGQPALGHHPPERAQVIGGVRLVRRGNVPIAAISGDVAGLAPERRSELKQTSRLAK